MKAWIITILAVIALNATFLYGLSRALKRAEQELNSYMDAQEQEDMEAN